MDKNIHSFFGKLKPVAAGTSLTIKFQVTPEHIGEFEWQ